MPLIILSGLPTSGKSTRAEQLHAYLAERIDAQQRLPAQPATTAATPSYRLHLISDETLAIPRTVYDLSALPAHTRSANAAEKDARAVLYGAVKRVLSPRDIVVLDGLNYIKGWRYQLACEAKNLRTASAVLQIGCSVDRARSVNEARLRRRRERGAGGEDDDPKHTEQQTEQQTEQRSEQRSEQRPDAEPYAPANWENLVFRYEEPNGMTRWDSPLFVLTWDDGEAATRAVFDQLWDAIAGTGRKEVRPNLVAVQRGNEGGGDFLYLLDLETQDVVKRLVEFQKEQAGSNGGAVVIPRSRTDPRQGELVVDLPGTTVGLAQLQRLRRAFMALNRGGIGLEGAGQFTSARLRESFVGYLNDALDKEA
ncbi:RNA polymerase 2 elongator complex subunit [Niveomyces insectorum RCEF 264]|uniref:RNA polymerase 2 elongator complex subunit n=1 Tax=Niveomyces insectorum RCEF 264 TaxID=1081102 RepID=A0A167QWV2_9HYPO|nr:RNA polymerase 2 elongator complex subunit [Niveomyces insectorum RCEF 264]